MLKECFHARLNFYQNSNASAESVRADVMVRKYEYGVIHSDLLLRAKDRSVQHYLLQGERGSGKSTLLRRLQVDIETDERLTSNYIAIKPAEEQANILQLSDLLEEIIHEFEYRAIEVEPVETELNEYHYCENLFYSIHRVLEKADKKLVLLLDNLDRIFENIGDGAHVLRAHLENFGNIKIIGGSIRLTEHFWAYDKPFYEFFRVMDLRPLKTEDVKELLLNWSSKFEIEELKEFVENKPGQLETIRILTDGFPRTLQFFVSILLAGSQDTGYEYLWSLMDKITPLYQERLNGLPPSQRKIVLQLGFLWESVAAKELARATRMDTRLISAQLSQLIDKGVAEKIETKTKNHLYRLKERFFGLWLLFTQGGAKEKCRARYLSIFLEKFYDEKELDVAPPKSLNKGLVPKIIDSVEQKDGAKEFISGVIRYANGDFGSAERLLLESFGKGYQMSAVYLARLYYNTNNKEANTIDLLLTSIRAHPDEETLALLPVVKAWRGDFKSLDEDVFELIRNRNPFLEHSLRHLLVHYQVDLIYKLFTTKEFGSQLVEQFLPTYYAVQLLMPETGLISIKIPPEIRETVNDLLLDIYKERDFYYR